MKPHDTKRIQAKRVEETLQKHPSWSRPPIDKTMFPEKIYRSHNKYPNARKQNNFQSPSKNTRCEGDPKKFYKKIFSIIQIQEPKTPYKWEPLSFKYKWENQILTTLKMGG